MPSQSPSRGPRLAAAIQNSRAVCLAAWLPILLAAGLGFLYIWLFGVNVPWADDWSFLATLKAQAAGTLTFSDLFAQHNEHRIFFPRLAMLGLAHLSQGNMVLDMYVSLVLLLGALALYLYAFTRDFPSRAAVWLMAPVAFLMTSWRQDENLLWGFQLTFVLAVVAAIAAFFFLSRATAERWRVFFIAAVVAATVAAFSSAHGLLAWPAGLLVLLLRPFPRRMKITLTLAWFALGAAEWAGYFHGYLKPAVQPDYSFSLPYFLTVLGGAVIQDKVPAMAAGGFFFLVLAILAVALTVVRRQWARHSFWLATMAFSFLAAVSLTVGRGAAGPGPAVPSRYATLVIPFVVGLYCLLVVQARDWSSRTLGGVAGVLVLVAGAGLWQSDVFEYREGGRVRDEHNHQVFLLATLDDQPERLLPGLLTAPLSQVRPGLACLKELHYSLFAPGGPAARYAALPPALPTRPDATAFHIDRVVCDDTGWVVSGWAVDAVHHAPLAAAYLVIDGRDYPLYYGLPRPDIAVQLHDERLTNCGFQRLLARHCLPPGLHQVSLKLLAADRSGLFPVPDYDLRAE